MSGPFLATLARLWQLVVNITSRKIVLLSLKMEFIETKLVKTGTIFSALFTIVLVASIGTFSLQRSSQSFDQKTALLSELFVKSIQNELMEGRYQEVYRRCSYLVKSSFVLGTTVFSNNQLVCDLKSVRDPSTEDSIWPSFIADSLRSKISKNITFGGKGNLIAGRIEILFSKSELFIQAAISVLFGLVLGALFLALSIQLYRLLARSIADPVVGVVRQLKFDGLESIASRDFLRNTKIHELFILQKQVKKFAQRIILLQNTLIEKEKSQASSLIARQTAHDIRSPLSLLKMLSVRLKGLSFEEKKALSNAIDRINEIADDLLSQSAFVSEQVDNNEPFFYMQKFVRYFELSEGIGNLVREKKEQFSNGLNIHFTDLGKYGDHIAAMADLSMLKRILSNLIDNSFEAGALEIEIKLYMNRNSETIDLSLADNGPGFSPEALKKLGSQEFTQGKEDGHGIGIKAASYAILSWGGEIDFTNVKEGRGAVINISLNMVDQIPIS